MAVYQFSALSDGQAISFNASVDRLNFDQTSVAAGDLTISSESSGVRVTVKSGAQAGKDVLLTGFTIEQIAASNFSFADGSAARVGDNSIATANDHGNNALTGTTGRDLLMGLGGNDNLQGGDNNDSLVGGFGNDTLNGNSGNDWMQGDEGNDVLTGSGGQDTFLFREFGSFDADSLPDFASNWDRIELDAARFDEIGAAGRFTSNDPRFFVGSTAHDADDRIIFNPATGQIFYDYDGNGAGLAQLIATLGAGRSVVATDFNVVNPAGSGNVLTGTAGDDTLIGTPNDDTLNGLGGNDSLVAGEGADSLNGGDGNDTLDAWTFGTGDGVVDTLNGGLGDDVYRVHNDGVEFGGVADLILADPGGVDTVRVLNGDWTLGAGLENLDLDDNRGISADGTGNALDNIIRSASEGGTLSGLGGNDTLVARHAQNVVTLLGGDGNDTLVGGWHTDFDGGAGDDLLLASATIDVMAGGSGADTFHFGLLGDASISDFASGADKIRLDGTYLTQIGTSGNFAAGDARFFAGAAAHDADDRVIWDGTTLWYDADGNGAGEQQLIARVTGSVVATDITVINGTGGGGGETINGTPGNDSLLGGPGNDTINAFGGNDSLDGAAGADLMDGGAGNDLYFVDDEGDAVVELENGGIDEVRSSLQISGLDAWVNNLTLTNNSFSFVVGGGNEIDNVVSAAALTVATQLDGLNGNDTLLGGSGNDELNGWSGNDSMVGGAGNDAFDTQDRGDGIDTMDGGAGDDTFFVTAGDSVSGGAGDDTVFSMVSWTLDATTENLHFHTGHDDHDLINVTGIGNALDNDINGIVINGGTLDGKAGNDTLEGSDLTPTDYLFSVAPGAANADLIGNFVGDAGGVDDHIVLDGTVHANIGASGTFAVGDARFFAAAGANAGHDADDRVVYNTTTGQLWYDADGNGAGVAQLIATLFGAQTLSATDIVAINGGSSGGPGQTITGTSGNDSLAGTAGNDSINGGSGNDSLAGAGGNDTLTGSGGQDTFIFREFGAANADRMTDFATSWDRIQVDDAAFTQAGAAGRLSAGDARFFAGTAAHDADDRFVFNTSTGQLYYDADGSGAGAAQLVATVQAGAGVVATDITVI